MIVDLEPWAAVCVQQKALSINCGQHAVSAIIYTCNPNLVQETI